MIHETEQDYKLTLQRNHAQRSERLINENEEQRNLRQQRLRERQSIRKEMELRGQLWFYQAARWRPSKNQRLICELV